MTKYEEVQLVYRNKTKASDRPNVKSPDAAYKILLENWNMDQINLLEECKILLLDNRLKLMSVVHLSKGGLSSIVVDLRIVFSIALKRRSNRIILAHNHPSGSLRPSKEDIEITQEGYCSLMADYEDELSNEI
ncbi:JAB domain-containing protein [Flavivirga aquimarina]|uniref:JAB domain-containing protein n=1 Tax=Flavivirga aquimarina TaxID=2027862 RepID=A0ABT8WB00_9FLAO|nr:JAB domain-containing protein [Flavivirga aquimarina]MDO5970315.1 JAB domain-containing protein [Flavivirga aquimarina]